MHRMISRGVLSAGMLVFVVSLGCGGGADGDRPATYPVSGTVAMNGQPVADANVNFQMVDGTGAAVGVTDAHGRYELTTFTAGDGAMLGEYRVAVTQFDRPPADADVDDDHPDYDPEAPTFVPENLLPERYADPATSGLTASVTEGQNTVDLDLTD